MKKRGKRAGLSIKINLTNRWLYSLIAIGILAIAGVMVYALTPGIKPNPGHLANEMAPPTGCVNGQVLQFIDSTNGWGCASLPTLPTGNLNVKVIEIGNWSMPLGSSVVIQHGLGASWRKVRNVQVIIRNDNDDSYRVLNGYDSNQGLYGGGVFLINSIWITLGRVQSGYFDSTNYDATNYNRGWITFWYE